MHEGEDDILNYLPIGCNALNLGAIVEFTNRK